MLFGGLKFRTSKPKCGANIFVNEAMPLNRNIPILIYGGIKRHYHLGPLPSQLVNQHEHLVIGYVRLPGLNPDSELIFYVVPFSVDDLCFKAHPFG